MEVTYFQKCLVILGNVQTSAACFTNYSKEMDIIDVLFTFQRKSNSIAASSFVSRVQHKVVASPTAAETVLTVAHFELPESHFSSKISNR